MNIMVYDVPAEYGGALTILKEYYDKALNDKENNWYFVISTPNLLDNNNIKVIKYPWIKKSWFHRLYFDIFISYKLVKKYNVDEVLSLQNIIIHGVKVNQILYVHQSLPFVEKKFKITENFTLWIYQKILGHIIFESIKRADSVIVQTNWMKNACVKKTNVNPNKIKVIQPHVNITISKKYEHENNKDKLFFYPANGSLYKNHKIIVEVVYLLTVQKISNFRVVFTLNGNESLEIKKLYNKVTEYNLPIDFIGNISMNEVYNYYSKSILVFPSYIETFGLPLLEARMHCSPIIASDCSFSHEILCGYDKVKYFNPFDSNELMNILKDEIKSK